MSLTDALIACCIAALMGFAIYHEAILPRRHGPAEGAGGLGDDATAARQLAARCDDLTRQLGRCGLATRRLDDAELAALHFACWCPDLAGIERLGRELRDADLVVSRARAGAPAHRQEVA